MKGPRFTGCVLLATVLLAAVVSTATAPAGRYTISNGTVFDTKTGLTWQQAANTSGLTEAQAVTYCTGLSGGWRLPSLKELATIVDFSTQSPCIDGNAFPNTPANYFWTSTLDNASMSFGWTVLFDTGTWQALNLSTSENVRCVH